MRVLLDENLPRRLTKLLGPEIRATTVGRQGWSGKKNGELLSLAEKEFDAFLTTDKGLPQQQNLANFDLAIVLLRAKSNDYEDLAPLMDETNVKLAFVKSGTAIRIPSDE